MDNVKQMSSFKYLEVEHIICSENLPACLFAVYVPPDANTDIALQDLHKVIDKKKKKT